MSITLEQAKALTHGTILEHSTHQNADGTPQRWKVNGKVKTWKRDAGRISIPVKHGLYIYGHITEFDLDLISLH